MARETPMMQQYLRLKAEAGDALLLFRLGDFYEMFGADAERAAPLLDLVLTTRDKNVPDPVPMCGIPYHAAEGYVRRLLESGHAVAIAEQVEDAKAARGLVRRAIVEVVSPGLVANAGRLADSRANYIAAIVCANDGFGLAFLDVSTGEFAATESDAWALVEAELSRVQARELVARDADKEQFRAARLRQAPDADFDVRGVFERVGRLPEGLEAHEQGAAARAAAALWVTVAELQPAALAQLHALRRYRIADRMVLDPSTRRHLELTQNAHDGGTEATLLERLDATRSPMGRRLLVDWLGAPLVDPAAIAARQDRLAEWLEPDSRRRELARALRGVGDLVRIFTRACLPASGPRELDSVRASLGGVAGVHAVSPLHTDLAKLRVRIDATLVEEPPPAPRGEPHTGYIRDGVDAEVDRIRGDSHEGQQFLATLEARERQQTHIGSLKVKYNRVFGYSIEVPKTQLAKVPEHYRRKQTTANAERYTTDELERWEGVVLRARENAASAETRVLGELRGAVSESGPELLQVAAEIAELDVLQSLAEVARMNDYVRPVVDDSPGMSIEAGRHPTVEHFVADGFVPNDVVLSPDEARFLILTGPNMAGKSTLLRQVALLTLMAQMGSWVPAASARIGAADRIFTRVGASDSLMSGESTFMVEMRETAQILREATPRSLILLDEIGRGTSTFDGLSIAWAVAEYLHDTPGLRARTLFATHYHELADLARTKPGVRNFHFAAAERGGEVRFLRRMEPGAASRSYGIEVARHAGLPREVIRRAREVLANLEGGEFDETGKPRLAREPGSSAPAQLGLFESRGADPLRESLEQLDVERLTPIEALVELDRLKRMLAGEQ
jgi:DNA mismatch repair protein MutS